MLRVATSSLISTVEKILGTIRAHKRAVGSQTCDSYVLSGFAKIAAGQHIGFYQRGCKVEQNLVSLKI